MKILSIKTRPGCVASLKYEDVCEVIPIKQIDKKDYYVVDENIKIENKVISLDWKY